MQYLMIPGMLHVAPVSKQGLPGHCAFLMIIFTKELVLHEAILIWVLKT